MLFEFITEKFYLLYLFSFSINKKLGEIAKNKSSVTMHIIMRLKKKEEMPLFFRKEKQTSIKQWNSCNKI